MFRIILFLVLIALAAAGAAWVADQTGDVTLSWGGWRVVTTLPVFVLALGVAVVAAMLAWTLLRALWRMPDRIRRGRRERRQARGRHAITQGLLAIGHGDSTAARAHAEVARRHAAHDPLALLLHAQSAQLDGDRAGAQRAFRAMAEREDTRLLGPARPVHRGAARRRSGRRGDDRGRGAEACAVLDLGFACGAGISLRQGRLERRAGDPRQQSCRRADRQAGLSAAARRAADGARAGAGKCRPRPLARQRDGSGQAGADADAGRGARQQISTARRIRCGARCGSSKRPGWRSRIPISPMPMPMCGSAIPRGSGWCGSRRWRPKSPGHLEGALAIARAAIDASEFARAREALAPFVAAPTQRVAMLMAEIERTEHGDSGRARAWTLRAVRALHDPVWTADGYVSDRWRPVSPVSGRLDAFQWQTPVAALPSDKAVAIEASPFEEAMLAPRRVEPPHEPADAAGQRDSRLTPPPSAAQDNSPALPVAVEPAPVRAAPAAAPAAAAGRPKPSPLPRRPCSAPAPTFPPRSTATRPAFPR